MKYGFQRILFQATIVFEALLGILLIFGVLCSALGVLAKLNFADLLYEPEHITAYLNLIATIVLSIEFTKMLCSHTLDSVVEVVSMAIAREIIAHDTTAVQNLLGVLAIAVLFTIRKFCYIPKLDRQSDLNITKQALRHPFKTEATMDYILGTSHHDEEGHILDGHMARETGAGGDEKKEEVRVTIETK